jgi:hypothetical protein
MSRSKVADKHKTQSKRAMKEEVLQERLKRHHRAERVEDDPRLEEEGQNS